MKPRRPVSQNAHSSAQPTWLDTQTLQRGRSSGMRTASKTWPSRGAEQVLHEGIDRARPAVRDLQPREVGPFGDRPRGGVAQAADAVEVVAVLEDQRGRGSRRATPGSRARSGHSDDQALRRSARAGGSRGSTSEPQGAAGARDFDLDLGRPDAEDADAVEACRLRAPRDR